VKKKLEDEEDLQTHHWNTRDKESHATLYILIAILSFLIAWVMT
jgi:hypothetical protein